MWPGIARAIALFASIALLLACGDDDDAIDGSTDSSMDSSTDAATMVGAMGGTVRGAGASIEIPAGALTRDVPIALREVELPIPAPQAYAAAGPAISILPEGQSFFAPVTLELPFEGDSTDIGVVAITSPMSPEWEFVRPTSIANGIATVETLHFSTWVVVRVTNARTGDTITTKLADASDTVTDEMTDPAIGYRPQIDVVVDDTRTTVRLTTGAYATDRSFELVIPGVGLETYDVAPDEASAQVMIDGVRYHAEGGGVTVTRADDRLGGTFAIEICPNEGGCDVTVMFRGSFDAMRRTHVDAEAPDLDVVIDPPVQRADGTFSIPYFVTNSGAARYSRAEHAAVIALLVNPPAQPVGGGQEPDVPPIAVRDLDPGEVVAGEIELPADAIEVGAEVYAVIDNDLAVPEQNEGNNVSDPVQQLPPDLVPALVGVTAENGVLYVGYEITNIGGGRFTSPDPGGTRMAAALCPAYRGSACAVPEVYQRLELELGPGETYSGVMIVQVGDLGYDALENARLRITGGSILYPDKNTENDESLPVEWGNNFIGFNGRDEGTAASPVPLGPPPIVHIGTAMGTGVDHFSFDAVAGTTYAIGLFGMATSSMTGYRLWRAAPETDLLLACDPPSDGESGAVHVECLFTAPATQTYYLSSRSFVDDPGTSYYLGIRPYTGANLVPTIERATYDAAAKTLSVDWVVRNTGMAATGFRGLVETHTVPIGVTIWAHQERASEALYAPSSELERSERITMPIAAGAEVRRTTVIEGVDHAAGLAAIVVNGYSEPRANQALSGAYIALHETSYDDNVASLPWGEASEGVELYATGLGFSFEPLGVYEELLVFDYSFSSILGASLLADPRPTCFTVAVWVDYDPDAFPDDPPDVRVINCAPELPRATKQSRVKLPALGRSGGRARVFLDYHDVVWENALGGGGIDNVIEFQWTR